MTEAAQVLPSPSTENWNRPAPQIIGYGRIVARFVDYAGGLLLAIVWLRSSAAHLSNPYYFLSTVYQYEIMGPEAGRLLAMILPFAQLVLVVCLIGRVFVGGPCSSAAFCWRRSRVCKSQPLYANSTSCVDASDRHRARRSEQRRSPWLSH